MEPQQENTTPEENTPGEVPSPETSFQPNIKEQFTTVTPFSKYLAMALFIILPVVGIWVGFSFGKDSKTEMSATNAVSPETAEELSQKETVPMVETWSLSVEPISQHWLTYNPIHNYSVSFPDTFIVRDEAADFMIDGYSNREQFAYCDESQPQPNKYAWCQGRESSFIIQFDEEVEATDDWLDEISQFAEVGHTNKVQRNGKTVWIHTAGGGSGDMVSTSVNTNNGLLRLLFYGRLFLDFDNKETFLSPIGEEILNTLTVGEVPPGPSVPPPAESKADKGNESDVTFIPWEDGGPGGTVIYESSSDVETQPVSQKSERDEAELYGEFSDEFDPRFWDFERRDQMALVAVISYHEAHKMAPWIGLEELPPEVVVPYAINLAYEMLLSSKVSLEQFYADLEDSRKNLNSEVVEILISEDFITGQTEYNEIIDTILSKKYSSLAEVRQIVTDFESSL